MRSLAPVWAERGRSVATRVFGAAVLVCLPLVLARERPSAGDDRGIFLGVLGRMLAGDHLYADVFEHKDPLYFYAALPFAKAFGAQGLFVEDALLLVTAGGLASLIALRLGLSPIRSVLASTVIVLLLTDGPVYMSGASQLLAIVLILAAILAVSRGMNALVGVLVALVAFAKLPLLVVLGPVILALGLPRSAQAWRRIVLGFVSVAVSGLLLLLVRGELEGYLDQLRLNLGYLPLVLRALKRGPAPASTTDAALDVLFGSPTLAVATAIMAVAAVTATTVLWRGWRQAPDELRSPTATRSALFLACLLGTLVFVVATAVFTHHLQVVAVPGFLAACVVLAPQRADRRSGVGGMVVLLVVMVLYSQTLPGLRSFLDDPGQVWQVTSVLEAPMAAVVEDAQAMGELPTGRRARLAVIGESNSEGLLFFLPTNVELGCPYFYQFPWYRSRLAELVECAQTADLVLVLPASDFILESSAEYRRFRASVEQMLTTTELRLIAGPDELPQGARLYVRDGRPGE